MAKVYADLIRKGLKTIDDVPERLKAEVIAYLKSLALDENGDPIVTEVETA